MQEKFLANLLCDLLVMHGITTRMESAIRIMETARGADQGHWRESALEMAQALVSGMPLSYVVELLRTLSAERGASTDEVRVIDMCCGVGNLARGIANAFRPARVWASDLSAAAVVLARCNVEPLGLN